MDPNSSVTSSNQFSNQNSSTMNDSNMRSSSMMPHTNSMSSSNSNSGNFILLNNNFLPQADKVTLVSNVSPHLKNKWPCTRVLCIPSVLIEILNEFIYYLLEINIFYYRERFNECFEAFMFAIPIQHKEYNIDHYLLFVLMNQIVVDFLKAKFNPDLVQQLTVCYNAIHRSNLAPEVLFFYYHTYLFNFEMVLKSDHALMIPSLAEIRLIAFLPRFMSQSQLVIVREHISQYDNMRWIHWNELLASTNMNSVSNTLISEQQSSMKNDSKSPQKHISTYEKEQSNDCSSKTQSTPISLPFYFNEEAMTTFDSFAKILEEQIDFQSHHQDTCLQVLYMQTVLCFHRSEIVTMRTIKDKIVLYDKVVKRIKVLVEHIKNSDSLIAFVELTNLLSWYNDMNLQCQDIMLRILQGSNDIDADAANPFSDNTNSMLASLHQSDFISSSKNVSNNEKNEFLIENKLITVEISDNEDDQPIPPPNQSFQVAFDMFSKMNLNDSDLKYQSPSINLNSIILELIGNDYVLIQKACDWLIEQNIMNKSNVSDFFVLINNNPFIIDVLIERLYNCFEIIIHILQVLRNRTKSQLHEDIKSNTTTLFKHMFDFSVINHINNIDVDSNRLLKLFKNGLVDETLTNEEELIETKLKQLLKNMCACSEFSILEDYVDAPKSQYDADLFNIKDFKMNENVNQLYRNCFQRLAQMVIVSIRILYLFTINPKLVSTMENKSKIKFASFIVDLLNVLHQSHGLSKYLRRDFLAAFSMNDDGYKPKFLLDLKNDTLVYFYMMLLTILNTLIDTQTTIILNDNVALSLFHQIFHFLFCNNFPHCNVKATFEQNHNHSNNDNNIAMKLIDSCLVIDTLCLSIVSKCIDHNASFIKLFHLSMGNGPNRCCVAVDRECSPFFHIINRMLYYKLPKFKDNASLKFFYYEWIVVFIFHIVFINNDNNMQVNMPSSMSIVKSLRANLSVCDQVGLYTHLTDIFYDLIQMNVLYLRVCSNQIQSKIPNQTQTHKSKYVSITIKSLKLLHFFVNILRGSPNFNFLDTMVVRLSYLMANISDPLSSDEDSAKVDQYLYPLFNTICKEYKSLFR